MPFLNIQLGAFLASAALKKAGALLKLYGKNKNFDGDMSLVTPLQQGTNSMKLHHFPHIRRAGFVAIFLLLYNSFRLSSSAATGAPLTFRWRFPRNGVV